ncbi:hypothetical protein V1512DRAFT_212029 [Lipomyces arxii]|uniref:uncharacterized protein n=1 Tax=Lipomyces arxii TaxID=56418 RepID=UPI0034CDFB0F
MQNVPGSGPAGPGQPGNIVFINYTFAFAPHISGQPNPAEGTSQQGENQTYATPRNDTGQPFQNGFFVYTPPVFDANTMGTIFGFGPGMGEPPKPHASKSALDALKEVDVSKISPADRVCAICYEPYYEKPKLTEVEREACEHLAHQPALSTETDEAAGTTIGNDEAEHRPLQMPCGHIFGQNCLKEWLKSSTTCPLCRTAVEAERPSPDAQQQGQFMPFVFTPFFTFFRHGPPASAGADTPAAQVSEAALSVPVTETPSPAIPVAPVVISGSATPVEPAVTGPTSETGQALNRNSSVGSSYAVRHHPYARPTESNPVSAEGNSLADVLATNDMDCGSALLGLCEESGPFIRLECGHGYHEDCLRTAMRAHGDADIPSLRPDFDVSTATSDQPRASREVWCMRCRRYRDVSH